ncbi:MAG: tetratricopeptide repeat protein [Verrucomicrobiota bacterium]
MKRMHYPTIISLGVSGALLFGPVPLQASPASQQLFESEQFQKVLIAAYGVNAEIEPGLNDEEQILIEEIYMAIAANELASIKAELPAMITPESSAALDFIMGNVFLQSKEPKQGIKWFESAIDKFPSFARSYRNLGYAQAMSGDHEAAVRSLAKVIELGKKDAMVYGVMANSFFELENYLAAESAYRNALMFDSTSLAYEEGVLQCMVRQQKYSDSVAATKSLINRYPARIDFWEIQADSYIGLDQPAKAAENLEVIRRMGGDTPALLNRLGDLYFTQEKYNLASKVYLDSLARNNTPAGVEGALKAAHFLAEKGQLDATNTIVNAVRKASGGNIDPVLLNEFRRLEARVLIRDNKNQQAAAILEQIVQDDPLDGEALLLLGDYYRESGDAEKAGFIYERAASLEMFEADAKVRHAQLLVQDAQYQKALPLLRQAQSINPRQSVEELLNKVERMSKRR